MQPIYSDPNAPVWSARPANAQEQPVGLGVKIRNMAGNMNKKYIVGAVIVIVLIAVYWFAIRTPDDSGSNGQSGSGSGKSGGFLSRFSNSGGSGGMFSGLFGSKDKGSNSNKGGKSKSVTFSDGSRARTDKVNQLIEVVNSA